MTLVGSGRSRERVLLFGMEGVGKSLVGLDIATRVHPNTLHVVDNDNAWDRMLEGSALSGAEPRVQVEMRWNGTDFDADYEFAVEGGNIIVWHTWGAEDEWTANTTALEQVAHEVTTSGSRNDWVLIDTGTLLWSAVQDWFVGRVFSKSIEDYFMQIRMEKEAAAKSSKSLGALDGWMDWPVINKTYAAGVGKFLVSPPCHLVVTAELAEVSGDDDSQTRALYTLGVKPKGQKRMGHQMQTVVMLRKDRGGQFYASTLKDRGGREYLENEDVTGYGWCEYYLEDVAGWTDTSTSEPIEKPGNATDGPVVKKAPVAKAATAPAPKVVAKS